MHIVNIFSPRTHKQSLGQRAQEQGPGTLGTVDSPSVDQVQGVEGSCTLMKTQTMELCEVGWHQPQLHSDNHFPTVDSLALSNLVG